VRCADESRGTLWYGQKAKLSPSADMLKSTPAGSTSSGELQTALLISFAKQKKLYFHYTTFSVF